VGQLVRWSGREQTLRSAVTGISNPLWSAYTDILDYLWHETEGYR
jgi:hypothetical protein